MSEVIVHMGMPKTGTTSLQFFLAQNREVLAGQGICYPDGAAFMTRTGTSANHNGLWIGSGYGTEGYHAACDRLLTYASRFPRILFSDESIFHRYYKDRGVLQNLRTILEEHGHTLRILIYLRRQDTYLLSSWAQRIGLTYTGDFAEFLSDGLERNKVDYQAYLARLSEDVGASQLQVRLFEKERFADDQALYRDFLSLLGIEDCTGFSFLQETRNMSLRGQFLETKRRLNRFPSFHLDKTGERDAAFCTARLIRNTLLELQKEAEEGGTLLNRSPITAQECAALLSSYDASNAEVARTYFGRKDGDPLFADQEIPEREAGSYTDAEIFDTMAALILRLEQKRLQKG
ncbi:MAG: hypothetical protein IJT34_05465 [Butyrivibrio sp.]|nr:hypothetical protein [Butyrivibrio sp.]